MATAPATKIENLALAIASGSTVCAWCATHRVSERTAYGWASKPEFKSKVVSLRSDLVDRALGRLSRSANQAVRALERIVGPRVRVQRRGQGPGRQGYPGGPHRRPESNRVDRGWPNWRRDSSGPIPTTGRAHEKLRRPPEAARIQSAGG